MDKYKIDVVMQGHDHTYSRTFQLEGDGKDHTSYSTYGYKSVEEAEKTVIIRHRITAMKS